jgi:hypothetical protein
MNRAAPFPPWIAMAHDADLPSNWSSVGKSLHANSLWILPLIATEQGFEGHYAGMVVATVALLISAYAAVKNHVLQDLFSKQEGRQRMLTWTIIFAGAALLALGIYRLSGLETPANGVALPTEPLQHAVEAPPKTAPLTKEAQELRSKEYVALYDFLGTTAVEAVNLGLKIPARYDPADKAERLQQVVRYYDAVRATFDGLQSIVQKYPFSDLEAEFTSAGEIGGVKASVLSPIPDCLDLLSAMPEAPPQNLLNYLRNKLGACQSTAQTLNRWVERERQSLSARIQGAQ